MVCPAAPTAIFACATQCDGRVTCTINPSIESCAPSVVTDGLLSSDLLDAAALCDALITETTPVAIEAHDGKGGAQPLGQIGPDGPAQTSPGALGGYAVAGTMVADLDEQFGAVGFVWGIGSHADQYGGGASTLLRAKALADDANSADVVVIAGGGGSAGALGGDGFIVPEPDGAAGIANNPALLWGP